MLIQDFCKLHKENYAELLEKNYAIKTKVDGNLILFKYNQIKSKFTNPLVRECRGLILDKNTFDIVCRPFEKFGNFGEGYVPKLNWNKISVLEKLDGSLIKIYNYKGVWRSATNGTIDAFKADLSISFFRTAENEVRSTFGDLVLHVLETMDYIEVLDMLDEDYTYLFELCSPFNRVVVPHNEPKLYYLSSKHNETGEEKIFNLNFPRPIMYALTSLEDCVEAAKKLPYSEEGYVACDDKFNRVKIKSPAYVAIHHLRGEGTPSDKRILTLVRTGEVDEFLNYFPEYADVTNAIHKKYLSFMKEAESFLQYLNTFSELEKANRRKFAELVKETNYADLAFKWLDGKINTVEEYYKDFPSDKLLGRI